MLRQRFLPFACWQRARLVLWHLARKRLFLVVREGDRSDHFQQACTFLAIGTGVALTCVSFDWLALIITLTLASEHLSLPAICRDPGIRKVTNHDNLDASIFFSCGWALLLVFVLVASFSQLHGWGLPGSILLVLLVPFASMLAVNKSHKGSLESKFAAIGVAQILMLLVLLPLGLLHHFWPDPRLLGLLQLLCVPYLLPLPFVLIYLGARYLLELNRPEEPQTFVLS